MSTAQQVIKDFMASLDKTLLQSTAALDEAIQYCTRGRFTSMSQVIDSFVRDCSAYGGTSTALSNAFLQEYCGINLNNADTGSIVGKDAGGTFVRTAESIVSEFGTTIVYPATASSTINGLTIKWPAKSTLTTVEQAIVARLNTWWTAGALNLIQEAYGLNFSELGTSVKEITVTFENNSRSNWLASVTNWSSNGKATKLQLNINMYYYNNMTDYVNGKSADSSAAYLDRTLAHEFTHAVMAANIDWFNKLPLFIKEGTAELVHGIDDFRTGTIRRLSGNAAALKSALNLDVLSGSSSSYNTDAYAAGYMFFRYLAKQMSNPTASGTLEVLPANYQSNVYDMMNMAASGIKDVSAVNVNRGLWMYGNSNNNVMWGGKVGSWIDGRGGNDILFAGTGGDTLFGGIGNDTLDGGAGVDWFAYKSGHGKDVVYNFEINKDIVELGYYYNFYNFAGMLDIGVSGSDVVIGLQNGSMTLKDAAGKQVKIHDAENNTYAHTYQMDKIILDSNYYSFTTAFELAKHTTSIRNIDASKTIQNIGVYGDSKDNTIWAGKGMDTLVGGKGNDTIYAGSCVNVFKYNAGDGNDVIWNYKVGVDLINLPGNFTGNVVGNDVVLQVNGSGTITLKNMANKKIRIAQGSGNASTYIYSLTKPFTGKSQIRLANATGAGIYTVTNGASDGTVAAFRSGSTVNSSVETKVGSVTAGTGAYYSYAADSKAAAQTIYAASNKVWSIRAGKGNDTVYAYGNATVNGGAGNDYISTSGNGNRLYGEEGNDTIWGGSGKETLDGGIGNDYLYGGNGNDSLNGSYGNDTLYGAGGNDTLRGGYGNDYMSGGDGNDYLEVTSGRNSLYGDGGNDILCGGLGSDSLYGGSGNDSLNGWANANLLVGGADNDILTGGAGIDTFRYSSGDGNDTISNYEDNKDIIELKSVDYLGVSRSGNDVLFKTSTGNITLKNKGTASHTLRYRDRNNVLRTVIYSPAKPFTGKSNIYLANAKGTGIYTVANGASDGVVAAFKSGSAVNSSLETKVGSVTAGTGAYYSYTADSKVAAQTIISPSNKAWFIRGSKGNDSVYAYGKSTVNGGAGNDYIFTTGSANRLYGEEGNDTILGGSANDTVDGGVGNDSLRGGSGNDHLYGGNGNDTLYGDNGNDYISASAGNNKLYGGNGNDTLSTGGYGSNYLDGGLGNDHLSVNAGNNRLLGGTGNDTLGGGSGNDTLDGGLGNDMIFGYRGNNELKGGQGKDSLYGGVNGAGVDKFCFGKGDGMDCIGQSDKKDIAYLYNVMGINQVNFSIKAGNLVMKLNNSDTLTVNNWMSSSTNQINTVQLGSGLKYTLGKSGNRVTVKRV